MVVTLTMILDIQPSCLDPGSPSKAIHHHTQHADLNAPDPAGTALRGQTNPHEQDTSKTY